LSGLQLDTQCRKRGVVVQRDADGRHSEAVKKLEQAPSRPLIFQDFRRFRLEPVPFFCSLSAPRNWLQRQFVQRIQARTSTNRSLQSGEIRDFIDLAPQIVRYTPEPVFQPLAE
jgi:hypothetical protein